MGPKWANSAPTLNPADKDACSIEKKNQGTYMALSTQSLFSEENNNQSIEYTVAAWLMSLPMDKHIHVSGVEVWVQSGKHLIVK